MMRIMMAVTSIAVTVFIAGCDHGVSVSAESVATSGYKGENSLSSNETQTLSKSNKESLKVPILRQMLLSANDYVSFVRPDGSLELADSPDWLRPVAALAKRAATGDQIAEETLVEHTRAIYEFRKAMLPSNGWPSSENESHYIYRKTIELTFADLLASAIAEKLPARFLAADDLDSNFVAALYSIPSQQLHTMQQRAELRARLDSSSKITIDGVSGKGTTWTAGISTYDGQAGGWIVRRGGVIEFGDSRIGGVTREVELSDASSLDAKIESGHRLGDHAGQDDTSRGTATAK